MSTIHALGHDSPGLPFVSAVFRHSAMNAKSAMRSLWLATCSSLAGTADRGLVMARSRRTLPTLPAATGSRYS
jgi:hypothetical protein